MFFSTIEHYITWGYIGVLIVLWVKGIFFRSLVGKFHNYITSITNVYVTHAYRWESSEIWDASFKEFSCLYIKCAIHFTILAIFHFTIRFMLDEYNVIIAVAVFTVALTIILVLVIRLHKKFCPDEWWKTSKRDRKRFGFGIL